MSGPYDEVNTDTTREQESDDDFYGNAHAVDFDDNARGAIPKASAGKRASRSALEQRVSSDMAQIMAELSLAKMKEELLRANVRIAELERGPAAAVQRKRIKPEEVEYQVSPFNGDDDYSVVKWFVDFEEAMLHLNGNEEDHFMMARHLIRDTARVFLRTIHVRNYQQLKQAMMGRYDRYITSSEVFKRLDQRTKRPDESFMHYVTIMEEIAQRAHVSEFELVVKIISGLRDTSGMLSVLGTARTIQDLIAAWPMYEAMSASAKRATATGFSTRSARPIADSTKTLANAVSSKILANTNRGAATQPDVDAVRCYNCSQYGHLAAQCTKPRRQPGSCFHCGSMEHQYKNCSKAPKRRVGVAVPGDVGEIQDAVTETEYDDLTSAISLMPLVSVSFDRNNGSFSESFLFPSLIDSGSPTSFVRSSVLPPNIELLPLKKSKYLGIRDVPIYTHGLIKIKLTLHNRSNVIKVLIVPDNDIPSDFLFGRDVLDVFKMDLHFRDWIKRLKNIAERRLNKSTERCKAQRICRLDLRTSETSDSNVNKKSASLIISGKHKDTLSDSRQSNECESAEDPLADLSDHTFDPIVNVLDVVDSDDVCAVSSACVLSSGDDFEMSKSALLGDPVNNQSDYSIDHDCDIDDIDPALFNGPFSIEPTLPVIINKRITELILSNYVNIDKNTVVIPHYEMNIHLTDDVPFYSHPRRLSHSEKNQVNAMVEDLLNSGVIRHSESPYASPIVLVKKKNGQSRLCIDYRGLNKKTVRDNYPMPIAEDCLEYLSKKNMFTLLDLKSGFHQVKMAENSRRYTSFVTPCGQYEYLKMPFGLKNAPAVFQRFINNILKDFIIKREIVVYMDDILIASSSISEHEELLGRVLYRIATNGLELQLNKCLFLHKELEFLGYIVSAEGIKPGRRKVEDILRYPVPTSIHSAHSFISLCSFFRRFVPRFSAIAHPINKLLRKDAKFSFDEECVTAFEKLKTILTSEPVLANYDPNNETELHTDASKIGYGAVLLQKQSDNRFHPIAYFSKSVGKHEVNYHSYELETLAIVYALGRFRTLLAGIPFTIVTDCNSLVLTFNKKEVNSRIARWVWEFEKFDYKIRHRKGEQMKHVDALSRNIGVVALINSNDLFHQLQVTQNRDPIIKNLKSVLEISESPPYEMHNGIVYRQNSDGKLLFYVPKEMETQLIQSVHERIGHFGSIKCYQKLKSKYWFPSMRAKVDSYVKNCIKCIIYSAPNRASDRTLFSIPKKPLPFDTLHIDHFGPLPSVNSKQKHILVVVDAFTKFVKVYPVTSTSTKEVCRTLDKYFEFYNRPARIISDRGTCFTSNEFNEFMDKHNIQHIKNAVASPQANGQVERINRVLKNMLGKLTEPLLHSDWVQQLKHVEYAINNSVQRSTGISPSILLFGVEQRGPSVDHLSEFLDETNLNVEERNLENIRRKASENIRKSQELNEAQIAQNSRPARKYVVGEYVVVRYIDTSAGNKKFVQKFRGPYVIHKVLPNDRYVVRDIEGSQITQLPYDNVIESKNIKLWRK